MFYPQEIIDQVIEANNIVDVISEYVKLTKKGSTYFGLCPFHNEKTPSFSVTDNGDRRMYYCFGCHAGGNVLTFLMKYENYTYSEALKVLADRAGITLPKPDYSKADAAKQKLKEQVLEINKLAAVYFYHLLKSERGNQAYNYLRNRELTDETIQNYGLGYSDKHRDDLYRYIKSKGYSDEVLKATGLFSIKETDTHDYFWNRVMFPIMDSRNKVIAFGGRVMGQGEPKYLNSPETVCFNKSQTLFGINVARKHKGNELILCEGYMDVISLHQAGFSNAVASLGTALTAGHAMALKRYTSNILISYDSDSAGRNAAVRATGILREAGLSVKVINLKPYKDPDELIKAQGAEEYKNRIRNSRNGLLFEIDVLMERYDLSDPDSKTRFFNEVAGKLSHFEEDIERENYIQAVSREFNIDLQMLRDKTKRLALSVNSARPYEPVRQINKKRENEKSALEESEKMVLCCLAEKPEEFMELKKFLNVDDFVGEPFRTMAGILYSQIEKGKVKLSNIIGAFEEAEMQEKAAEIFSFDRYREYDGQMLIKALNDCAVNIKKNTVICQLNSENDISKVLLLKKEQEHLTNLQIFGGQLND